jgi:hypothetical protein
VIINPVDVPERSNFIARFRMRSLGYPSQETVKLSRYLGQSDCSNMMKPIFIIQYLDHF